MKDMTEQELQNISRRAFLMTSTKAAAGLMVASATAGLIDPQTVLAAVKPKAEFKYTFKEASADSLPNPMKYPGLDPKEAMERAYWAYFNTGG